jgi:hypothetical protein
MKTKTIVAGLLLFIAIAATAQKKIQPNELPAGSVAFIEKHFPNRTIHQSKKDSEHGEKGFEVILSDGTEVEFWQDGGWREVDGNGNPIPTSFISANILEYVQKNYPKEKITHIDYGHKDVDVDLTNTIDLEFDKSGRFLKANK